MTAAPGVAVGFDPADGLADDLAAAALALARRLHAGGTTWCASPASPSSPGLAQRVARELAPALPAVALPSHGTAAAARAEVRAGDVLLLLGAADDAGVRDLARRAPAWGGTTLWAGAGRRPPAGAADHVLWLPDDETAAHDRGLLQLVRLLGELTRARLERRAGLEPEAACDGPVCTTCSDEGRLAEVVSASGATARVRTAGGAEDVDLSLVGGVAAGDLLVVHAGMALTRLAATS